MGGDLRSYIDLVGRKREDCSGGFLEDEEARVVIYQILHGLGCIHDRGVAHRDIKPENVLVSPTLHGQRFILADFGNAVHLGDANGCKSRRMRTLCGTPHYAAPCVH